MPPRPTHELVEDRVAVDVRKLSRQGLLEPEGAPQKLADFGLTLLAAELAQVVLSSGLREVTVELEWVPCRLGGERAWFRCLRCSGRRALLYAPKLLCRECLGLRYQAQRLDAIDRRYWRAERLR